jgi:hypothetical protein
LRCPELVAKALGRDIVSWNDQPTKSQAFEALKLSIEASDPRARKMITEVLSKLLDWIKEVPETPEP